MTLDPLVRRGFASADAYELGRCGYAPQAVRRAAAELELDNSSRLLDLAAGTGLLTRMLAPLVGSVVAVEPSRAMRDALTRALPEAEVLDGVAQRLPLPDGSVDAIVVGEAFHWFHGADALDEMARVLRPRGGLALLWNVPIAMRPRTDPELAELLERHRAARVPPERRYATNVWRRAFDGDGRWEALSSVSAEHEQRLGADAYVARIASWSFIASLPRGERERVLGRARALAPASCTITMRTDLHWTRKVAGAAGHVAGASPF